jgi:Co/Zn/Cd efflux system component
MNANLRKVVIIVAALNLAYFGVEFAVALVIDSVSLFADSVDFLEDASVNFLIAISSVRLKMGMLHRNPIMALIFDVSMVVTIST